MAQSGQMRYDNKLVIPRILTKGSLPFMLITSFLLITMIFETRGGRIIHLIPYDRPSIIIIIFIIIIIINIITIIFIIIFIIFIFIVIIIIIIIIIIFIIIIIIIIIVITIIFTFVSSFCKFTHFNSNN